jgi:hypothetical protein
MQSDASMHRYTKAAIQDLKDDEDEMLRGVDWAAVARYVDLTEDLQGPRWAGVIIRDHPVIKPDQHVIISLAFNQLV